MNNDNESARQLMIDQMLGRAKEQFSQPKISEDDSGDLAFMIAPDEKAGVVRLRFSKPVVWLAFEPAQARMFCNTILEKVNILESAQEPPQE